MSEPAEMPHAPSTAAGTVAAAAAGDVALGAATAGDGGGSVTRRATSSGVQSPSAMCSVAVKGSRVPCNLIRTCNRRQQQEGHHVTTEAFP